MVSLQSAIKKILSGIAAGVAGAWKAFRAWISIPVNLCLSLLALSFLVSFISWACSARFTSAVLFFPDEKGGLRGEKREIPRRAGLEDRAELIASELLLGPARTDLSRAFVSGARLVSVLYRRGTLYVNLSPDAALPVTGAGDVARGTASVKTGLSALERSLRAALPGIGRITLAIGGYEPFLDGLPSETKGVKKSRKSIDKGS
jgi:hypothetical protein